MKTLRDEYIMAALAALPVSEYSAGRLISCEEISDDAIALAETLMAKRERRKEKRRGSNVGLRYRKDGTRSPLRDNVGRRERDY